MTAGITEVVRVAEARKAARSGWGVIVRRSAGISQAEAAVAIDVSPATLCKWEKGARVPRGAAALRYLELLRALEGASGDQPLAHRAAA